MLHLMLKTTEIIKIMDKLKTDSKNGHNWGLDKEELLIKVRKITNTIYILPSFLCYKEPH